MQRTSLVTVVLLSAAALYPQANQGALSGVVTDPSGALIVGARITVDNARTGIKTETQSNNTGVYRVPAMEPGQYRIIVEKEGFQRVVIPDVVLQVGQILSVDVSLPVGSTVTTVEVPAPTELLQTETAAIGNTLPSRTVESLPLNGRNFLQLAALIPGVNAAIGSSAFSRQNKVQVMAGALSNTAILFDGADINTDFDEGSLLTLNIDAIADYKVVTNSFAAEYGFGNSALNISSKSGTNQLHGTLFEFLRNDVFDARNFFNPRKAPLRQNQYGVAFGGPISRNNTFFFVDWQAIRNRLGATINAVVPTLDQRRGDFSAVAAPLRDPATGQTCTAASRAGCFTGNLIPQNRLNPVALYFLPFIREPNNGPNLFTGSASNAFDANTFDVRIDHHLQRWWLKNDRIFGRYSYDKRDGNNPGANPGVTDQPLDVLNQNAVLGWTHTFAGNVIFDLRGSYYRESLFQDLAGGGVNHTVKSGIGGFEQFSQRFPGFPTLSIGGGVMGIDVSGSKPVGVNAATHSDVDTSLIWVRGRHSFKTGFHFRKNYGGNFGGGASRGVFGFTGFYTGNGTGDFLLGIPQTGSRSTPVGIVAARERYYHGYFMDNWKLGPRLTLDLGVRLEFNNPPYYPRNQAVTFDRRTGKIVVASTPDGRLDLTVQGAGPLAGALYADLIVPSSQAGLPPNFISGTHWNLAPRLGIAWRPLGDRTVFRVGYGIFLVPPEIGWFKAVAAQNVPFVLQENVTNPALTEVQNFFGSSLAITQANRPLPSINALDPDYQVSYQQQWNVAIQRTFGSNLSFEIAYVGAQATHLQAPYRFNDPLPGPQATIQQRRPYPFLGSSSIAGFGGTGSYNALQVNATKKMSAGFSYTGSYSWSKSIHLFNAPVATTFISGVEQIAGRLDLERASAFYQPPHRFIGSYIYELPIGTGKRFDNTPSRALSKLLSGWATTGIVTFEDGAPFGPGVSTDRTGTGTPRPRPNYAGGPLYPEQRTLARWFIPTAFAVPPAMTFGNAGLNILRAPGVVNFDLGVIKDTAIAEGKTLQFRCEWFNATNTPKFAAPTNNIENPRAGEILGARDGRIIQFALKFLF